MLTKIVDQNQMTRPELVWVTDHLLLPDHRYGTVCWQICT